MVSAILWSCVLLSVGPLNIHRVCCLPAAEAQSLLSSLWCFSAGSHLRNLAIPGLHAGQLSYNVFRYMFRRESREISGNMNKTDGDDNSETALLEETSCASYLQKLAVSLHSCGALLHALWRLLYLSSACCFGHWRHWPTIWTSFPTSTLHSFLNLSVLCPGTYSQIPKVPNEVPHFLNHSSLYFHL